MKKISRILVVFQIMIILGLSVLIAFNSIQIKEHTKEIDRYKALYMSQLELAKDYVAQSEETAAMAVKSQLELEELEKQLAQCK